MTLKQLFLATQIELNKMQAPSLKLFEFNYLANKACRRYANKIYNIYDINLQTTDDLRVLKSSCFLTPTPVEKDGIFYAAISGPSFEATLPLDYFHLLNCICIFKVKQNYNCYKKGSYRAVGATRLTPDSWAMIVEDIYNRPSINKPYYYIHNLNQLNELPTNPYSKDVIGSTDSNIVDDVFYDGYTKTTNNLNQPNSGLQLAASFNTTPITVEEKSNLPRTTKFKLNLSEEKEVSKIDVPATSRIGNQSDVRIEIRCGSDCGQDDSIFDLAQILIDYLKVPQYLKLTTEQIDKTIDTSQVLEFPDYGCQEIINDLVSLIMEHVSDPRLTNYVLMKETIARPSQNANLAQA